jgi:Tfp pilus assembly protein PilX
MKTSSSRQRGATLVIGLILLIVLTLMGVAAINMGTLNLRNTANMQYRQMVLAAAMECSENLMSSASRFAPPTASSTCTTNGMTVNLSAPKCLYSYRTWGWSATGPLCAATDDACGSWENYFDFAATVTDNLTGATANVHYGVMIEGGKCS